MPQVHSEELSLKRKLRLQEQMASLGVVPRRIHIDRKKYESVHKWIKYHYKKPKACFVCFRLDTRLDWACIKEYEKDIKNFKALCRRCHTRLDTIGSLINCKWGHRMSKENTYSYPIGTNFGSSECRTCRKIKQIKRGIGKTIVTEHLVEALRRKFNSL